MRAALVVDTRPPAPLAQATGLLQMFIGWEIETPRPVFDAGAAELMIFDSGSSAWVGFSYILPYSPTRALIEYTRFAARASDAPQDGDVFARVAVRAGNHFALLRRESGTLCMRVEKPAAHNGTRILHLGTLAGAARATTGYAFTAIQAQAAALTQQLQHGCPAAFGWRAPPLAFLAARNGPYFPARVTQQSHAGAGFVRRHVCTMPAGGAGAVPGGRAKSGGCVARNRRHARGAFSAARHSWRGRVIALPAPPRAWILMMASAVLLAAGGAGALPMRAQLAVVLPAVIVFGPAARGRGLVAGGPAAAAPDAPLDGFLSPAVMDSGLWVMLRRGVRGGGAGGPSGAATHARGIRCHVRLSFRRR